MKHFYYPTSVVACGLSIDDLKSPELVCDRREVTCLACKDRLLADQATCKRCAANAAGEPVYLTLHTCGEP